MHIYLAGTEGSITEELLGQKGVHRGFSSYFYIKSYRGAGLRRLDLLRASAQTVVIDSGAHTFFSSSEYIPSAHTQKSKKKIQETPEHYFGAYLDFLLSHVDAYDYFVELDIGEIVGQKQVCKWRDRLAKAGLIERCLIVHHPAVESLKRFLAVMREWPSRYVALQGYRNGRLSMDYVRVIRHCYEAGVRVHGFAMTKAEVLGALPFYSVDSSTWLAGAKYGRITLRAAPDYWTGLQFCRPRDEAHKNRMSRVAIENEVRLPTIARYRRMETGDRVATRTEVLRLAAKAYAQMEEFYTRLWESRGVDWNRQTGAYVSK